MPLFIENKRLPKSLKIESIEQFLECYPQITVSQFLNDANNDLYFDFFFRNMSIKII